MMKLALIAVRGTPVAADYRMLVAALIAAQATTPTARLHAGAAAMPSAAPSVMLHELFAARHPGGAEAMLGHSFSSARGSLSMTDAGRVNQDDRSLYRPISSFVEVVPVNPEPMTKMAAEQALGAATRG